MVASHSSVKRIVHRIGEECRSTAEIARLTSWPEALETFIAKVDIQVMNRNGFKESPAVRNRLVRKHEILVKYFEKRYGRFAEEYDFHAPLPAIDPAFEGKIWMCWWQGLDQAPEIVKRCVESIKRNAGDREVIIITDENYEHYADIPQWVKEKRRAGIITRTHLSDLLRFILLAQYGGLWLDSTFFCTSSLEDTVFSPSLWSIKRPDYFHASVAQGYFANYSFACHSDERWVFAAIRDFILEYWRTNDSMVDYLFVDYLIVLAIRHNATMKETFAAIPSNNPDCDELFKVLEQIYDERIWDRINVDTSLFKLTWKRSFPVAVNGHQTFYGKLIDGSL